MDQLRRQAGGGRSRQDSRAIYSKGACIAFTRQTIHNNASPSLRDSLTLNFLTPPCTGQVKGASKVENDLLTEAQEFPVQERQTPRGTPKFDEDDDETPSFGRSASACLSHALVNTSVFCFVHHTSVEPQCLDCVDTALTVPHSFDFDDEPPS